MGKFVFEFAKFAFEFTKFNDEESEFHIEFTKTDFNISDAPGFPSEVGQRNGPKTVREEPKAKRVQHPKANVFDQGGCQESGGR